jgi:hypothetical protein
MQDILCIFTPANAEFLLHTSIGVGSEEGRPGSGTGVCDSGIGGGNAKGEEEIGTNVVCTMIYNLFIQYDICKLYTLIFIYIYV